MKINDIAYVVHEHAGIAVQVRIAGEEYISKKIYFKPGKVRLVEHLRVFKLSEKKWCKPRLIRAKSISRTGIREIDAQEEPKYHAPIFVTRVETIYPTWEEALVVMKRAHAQLIIAKKEECKHIKHELRRIKDNLNHYRKTSVEFKNLNLEEIFSLDNFDPTKEAFG